MIRVIILPKRLLLLSLNSALVFTPNTLPPIYIIYIGSLYIGILVDRARRDLTALPISLGIQFLGQRTMNAALPVHVLGHEHTLI